MILTVKKVDLSFEKKKWRALLIPVIYFFETEQMGYFH